MEGNKKLYYIAILIGSTIGGYLPTLFGADLFSLWSVIGSFVVAMFAIWLVYKMST